jgi:cell division protein FtsW
MKPKRSFLGDEKYLSLIIPVFTLTCFGILFVYSSSTIYSFEKYNDEFLFLKKHLVFVLTAFLGLYLTLKIPFSFFLKYTPFLYLGFLLLCALTLVPHIGHKVGGAARWIKVFGYQLQPSEFLKIFTLLFASTLLTKYQNRLMPLWLLSPSFFVLLLQPDFGSCVVLALSLLAVLFVHGIPKRYFIGLLGFTALASVLLIFTKAYRLKRILSFIDPYADPLGKGFQVIQGFVAVASGGLAGKGLGESSQKLFFLPEAHTDFILAVIAEETGFLGVLSLSFLYFVFFLSLLKILLTLKDETLKLALTGFLVLMASTTLINMGVVAGVLPTKGLPLPFISSGGSALLANFFVLGLIFHIVRKQDSSSQAL